MYNVRKNHLCKSEMYSCMGSIINSERLCQIWVILDKSRRGCEDTGLTSVVNNFLLHTTVIVTSAGTGPDSTQVFNVSAHQKYHAVYKHDTPPSHFKLTLVQPAMIYFF